MPYIPPVKIKPGVKVKWKSKVGLIGILQLIYYGFQEMLRFLKRSRIW